MPFKSPYSNKNACSYSLLSDSFFRFQILNSHFYYGFILTFVIQIRFNRSSLIAFILNLGEKSWTTTWNFSSFSCESIILFNFIFKRIKPLFLQFLFIYIFFILLIWIFVFETEPSCLKLNKTKTLHVHCFVFIFS